MVTKMKDSRIVRTMAVLALTSTLMLLILTIGFSPKARYPLTVTRVEKILPETAFSKTSVDKEKPQQKDAVTTQGASNKTISQGNASAEKTATENQMVTNQTSQTVDSAIQYGFPININDADQQALMQVKGIGEKRSQQIMDYLHQHGRIKNMEELLEIKGIGEMTLERLCEKFYADSDE